MKKLVSAALVIALLCLCAPAFAESAHQFALAQSVKDALDSKSYIYEYDASRMQFTLTFSIDNTLETCEAVIRMFDNGYMVLAYSSVNAIEANKVKMAEYCMRISASVAIGNFEMSYETGQVWYKQYQLAKEAMPDQADVLAALSLCVNMLEDYGDGIAKVGLLGYDPKQAFEEYH